MALPARTRPTSGSPRRAPRAGAPRAGAARVAATHDVGAGAPTGFALYVEFGDGATPAPPHELARTAETLRELVREWVPQARTRTVVTRAAGETPLPPGGSTADLRARLRAVPDVPRIHLDVPGRRLTIEGEPVRLTVREFDLLATLATAEGRVIGREELLATVWHGRSVADASRTVDVHVRRIRAAVGPDLIVTVRGSGYCVPPRPHLVVTR